jgi:hypothetical protein
MKFLGQLLSLFVVFLALPATILSDVITVDENGNGNDNGVPLSFTLGFDPGPGGLSGVLIYELPFSALQGDIFLTDADFFGLTLDVVRFNGNGTLIFYSDNIGGFDSLGDTTGPPRGNYTNMVTIPELGPEGNNGAIYAPTSSQPGWDPSIPTYHFISDSVPEPGPLLLLGTGLGMLGLKLLGRRNC